MLTNLIEFCDEMTNLVVKRREVVSSTWMSVKPLTLSHVKSLKGGC